MPASIERVAGEAPTDCYFVGEEEEQFRFTHLIGLDPSDGKFHHTRLGEPQQLHLSEECIITPAEAAQGANFDIDCSFELERGDLILLGRRERLLVVEEDRGGTIHFRGRQTREAYVVSLMEGKRGSVIDQAAVLADPSRLMPPDMKGLLRSVPEEAVADYCWSLTTSRMAYQGLLSLKKAADQCAA